MRPPFLLSIRTRPGFTLIELLVAVLLIDVGVLAMVSATALLTRRHLDLRARVSASQLATNRIQRLTAGPCAASVGSATSADNAAEHWAATVLPNSVLDLRDSVVFLADTTERSIVVRSRVRC